jgi:hypothetical protein
VLPLSPLHRFVIVAKLQLEDDVVHRWPELSTVDVRTLFLVKLAAVVAEKVNDDTLPPVLKVFSP